MAILTVIAMFLIRVGIPLILLVAIGTLIDRRQSRQRAQAQKIYKLETNSNEHKADKAA